MKTVIISVVKNLIFDGEQRQNHIYREALQNLIFNCCTPCADVAHTIDLFYYFKEQLQHFQIKEQWLNCDLKKAFTRRHFLMAPYMVPILQVHLTFLMLFGKCFQYALRSLACNQNLYS